MKAAGKILKTTFWAVVVFAPMFYLGSKALPMITNSIQETKKISAQTAAKKHARMQELENLAAVDTNENSNENTTGEAPATSGHAIATSKSKNEIIITNENSGWDPAAEERIAQMMIPEKTKQLILDNYHRTGVLPEALSGASLESSAGNRQPASVVE